MFRSTLKCAGVVLITGVAGLAIAQDQDAEAQAAVDKRPFGELPPNTGWLSDPNTPAQDLWEAIGGGKLHLNNRLRYEYHDMESDGAKPAHAFTNRLRLGYETKPFKGFNAMIEFENVISFDKTLYWVPATRDGSANRAVVADPQDTEVNQAWVQYHLDEVFESEAWVNIKVGRQRITLDDERFVGNVGWRQFEQTYDAVLVQFGNDPFTFSYAHVWKVQGIFSNGVDLDADTHIFHLAVHPVDWITVTPFVYLVDVQQAPALDSDTYGVRLHGSTPIGQDDALSFAYNAYYAHQTEGRNSSIPDYDADFFAIDLSVAKKELGALGAGYQFIGSDGGADSFIFPLGTNHAFNGWADRFLATPVTGLQDLYGYVKADLPKGFKGMIVYHQFWSDVGSTDFGSEIDAVVSKKISKNWSVLGKFAHFMGDALTDNTKFWVETTFSF